MKKSEKYAWEEAYLRGYKDALNEFDDALAGITAWQEAPEFELAKAIKVYMSKIGKA
jgi:hypothetical protein